VLRVLGLMKGEGDCSRRTRTKTVIMVISAAARESEFRGKVPVVATKDYELELVCRGFLLTL